MAELLSRYEWFDAVCRDGRKSMKAFAVASALRSFMNERSADCFPGRETVAAMAGCSGRTVRDAVLELVDLGFLEVGGGKRSRIYSRRLPDVAKRRDLPIQDPNNTAETEDLSTKRKNTTTKRRDLPPNPCPNPVITPPPIEDHRLVIAAIPTAVGDISTLDGCAELLDMFDESGLTVGEVLDGLPPSVHTPIGYLRKKVNKQVARFGNRPSGAALRAEIAERFGLDVDSKQTKDLLSALIAELRTVFPNLETPLPEPIRNYIDEHPRNDRNAA